jgi:hypothetical protein
LVLHAVTLAFDDDGLGVVQEAVEERGGQCVVVIEDLWPLLVDAVGGDDRGAALVAMADDLEEQVSAGLVDRKVSKLVQDEDRGLEVLVQLGLKPSGRLRGGQVLMTSTAVAKRTAWPGRQAA